MRKIIESKKNVVGLLIVVSLVIVLIMSFVFAQKKDNILGAKEQNQDKIMINVNNIPITERILAIDGNQAEVELATKKNNWVKIPLEKGFSITQIVENEQESSLPVLALDDFDMKTEIERLKSSEKSETTTDQSTAEIDKENSSDNPTSVVFQTIEKNREIVYIRLIAKQPVKLKVNRENSNESTVKVVYLDEQKSSDTILKLVRDEQFLEKANLLVDEETENDQSEKFKTDESLEEDSLEVDSRVASVSTPFNVSVAIDRLTGIAPFDTTDDSGYDSSPNNDRVRTFDAVNYTLRAGISINTSSYKSMRVRVDTKVNDAWRLDRAGKVRQTAELLNGTLVNGTSGTKTSTHSTWVNVEATSGQIFVTETLNTYGGVNNDEINPEFVLTIESAVTSTGETVSINQVIDKSVSPNMSDKVYLSAKPYVEMKIVSTPSWINEFDKLVKKTAKPNTLVEGVAAYAQLKPLPGRTDLTSLKGVTYPIGGINYTINQKIFYQAPQTSIDKELIIGKDTEPVQAIVYRGGPGGPNVSFTKEYSSYSSSYSHLDSQSTSAPYGYTRKSYSTDQTYSNLIGIYDTGNPIASNDLTSNSISVINNDYTPISVGKNKWLYSGAKMGSNSEPFSVIYMQAAFPYNYIAEQTGTNSSLAYELSIGNVNYENISQKVATSTKIIWDQKWPGGVDAMTSFQDAYQKGLNSNPPSSNYYQSLGDGVTTQGNKIWTSHYNVSKSILIETNFVYARWNANSFAFDSSRKVATIGGVSLFKKFSYGVGPSVPDVSLRERNHIDNSYKWYETVDEAQKNGPITAVKGEYKGDKLTGQAWVRYRVPLTVIGSVGVKDTMGNPNISYTNVFDYDDKNNLILSSPSKGMADYVPTKYDNTGKNIGTANPVNRWGDTLYINSVLIRPTISSNKSNYNPTEQISWTANGSVSSGSDQNHKVQLDVTIPKETLYEYGSATNHKGEPIPNPAITENSDGTRTLRFIQDYLVSGNDNPTVNFKTSIISSALSFVNNQATLSAKVVSQIWLEDDPSVTDSSSVSQRTSNTAVTVSNAGVIVIDKVTDELFIESGNEIDPANLEQKNPTDITYTISYKNHSTGSLGNVRALDVLPYNGDGRGTKYSGSYNVINVTRLVGKGDLWYTDTNVSVEQDPNLVNLSDGKWKKLGNDQSILSNSKAIMAVYASLPPGEDFSYSVTLRPKNQKAGDCFANSPTLNSNLNQLVKGVVSDSSVLGRELSGIAWYDDNLDGIIGKSEERIANVPVKLYRTSQINNKYKQEVVKESLTGTSFIDKSNNSLVKTNSQGEYIFENLAEGEYIVEFVIADQLQKKKVLVTQKMVGNDSSIHSKANIDTAKTDSYIQPILFELPNLVNEQGLYRLSYMNIGLIRPSKVSLFKYIAGTAVDTNGDGKFSDEDKAKGTPLKNAEFELYDAESDKNIGKATTDATGVVSFDGLFPGNYYLIETKSPEGYELIKKKVSFDITEGNQTVKLYQDDSASTKLPFTGSDKTFIVLVIASSSLILFGLVMVIVKSRLQKRR